MTAQPHDLPLPSLSMPEKNLRSIRSALTVRQDREAFDAGLKAVLDEVRVSLDLNVLNAFIHRWWISACDSVKDPEGRRQMHAKAEQLISGKSAPAGRPWREVLAARGVEL